MEPSLRFKIGQMLIMGFEDAVINPESPIMQAIETDAIGGVILFDLQAQTQRFEKNIQNPNQVRTLNGSLQSCNTQARAANQEPLLPLIISVDYEGGHVNRLKENYGFPATISAAEFAQLSPEEQHQTASAMAKTLKDLGFNLDFAPVVDVNCNLHNPIIAKLDRSFSSDPQQVSAIATCFVDAFAQNNIQCVYKHFPGHGSSQQDSHLGFVDVTDTWHEDELIPYEALRANPICQMIMTAHIVNRHLDPSGLPATLSYPMLTGILRETLGFSGIIITDDMQMKAISDHYPIEKSVTLAINAGADMLIFGNQLSQLPQDPRLIIDLIESQIQQGQIAVETIDAAYARIERFKRLL